MRTACFYVLKWKARQTVLYPVALPRRCQSSPMTNPIHLAPHKQIIWEDFWKKFLGTRNYQWLLKLLFGSGIWLTFPWSNQVTWNMMWVRESTLPITPHPPESSSNQLGTKMQVTDNSVGKESACSAGDLSSIPGLGKSSGEGLALTTPVFLGLPWWLSW